MSCNNRNATRRKSMKKIKSIQPYALDWFTGKSAGNHVFSIKSRFLIDRALGLCIVYRDVYRCHDAPPPPAPAIPKMPEIL